MYKRQVGGGAGQEFGDLFFRQGHGEQAVVGGVLVEDIGEAGGNDDEDSEVGEGPGGVLAGAAAAEVASGEEDGGLGVGLAVEEEVLSLIHI